MHLACSSAFNGLLLCIGSRTYQDKCHLCPLLAGSLPANFEQIQLEVSINCPSAAGACQLKGSGLNLDLIHAELVHSQVLELSNNRLSMPISEVTTTLARSIEISNNSFYGGEC